MVLRKITWDHAAGPELGLVLGVVRQDQPHSITVGCHVWMPSGAGSSARPPAGSLMELS